MISVERRLISDISGGDAVRSRTPHVMWHSSQLLTCCSKHSMVSFYMSLQDISSICLLQEPEVYESGVFSGSACDYPL